MMYNKEIDTVKEELRQLGACRILDEAKGMNSLAALIFSPQGAEFVTRHHDEKMLALFRKYADKIKQHNIYVDCGVKRCKKNYCAAFVGNTEATISCHGAERIYTIVVLGGAKVTINARNYAVVRLYKIDGEVQINKDTTTRILE